jgi:AAA15 family ATPase/GTPase
MNKEENNHFIKNIEIKNFKCFKDFKAQGFGRVNLIGGKNNVGKTALMEACYINVGSRDIKTMIWYLHGIKFMRENLNILDNIEENNRRKYIEKSNKLSTKSNINFSSFNIQEKFGIKKYKFIINSVETIVNVNDFSSEFDFVDNVDFIDNFGLSNSEIITAYGSVQKEDNEEMLNKLINKFDKDIIAFKIIKEKPQCKIKNGEYLEITEFGDGVRHLISIIVSLYKSANGYLFIDEMDNGIHYTMLDKLWDAILDISKKLNVQVFATTHSKDGIESYARVAKIKQDKDIKYVKITKLKDDTIMAGVRDYDVLQYMIDDGHEARGI